MSVYNILEELRATSSRLEKEAILKKNEKNDLLKQVVFLALDPYTQFYQRKIPEYVTARPVWKSLDSALDKLKALSNREVTGNAAIEYLSQVLASVSKSDAEVIERVIKKDLKCGASESTANKTWPSLIHEYPCMLCTPFDEKILKKFSFPAYAQLKMDGMRFNAIVKDGKCEFRSRNGKEIQLLGNLEMEFITMSGGQNLVFDGELLVNDKGVILDRQTGNGILNKAVKGTISDLEAHKVHATVWDVIDYETFKNGRGKLSYQTRFSILESMSLPRKVRLVESRVVASFEEAQKIFEEYLAQGQEGIILKDMSGVWEDKRVKTQVKFKAELDCDLKIVGIQPGTGKYEGLVGALLCESEDGIIKVDVGSGLSDFDRKEFTENSPVGKIAAVVYNARIKNKQGEESLFLPRLMEIREDKNIADSAKNIR